MALRFYLLDGHEPYEVEASTQEGFLAWAEAFSGSNKRVALDELPLATVSTVFLGMDHGFWGEGPPLIFETMIFAHPQLEGKALRTNNQWRCSTWDQALALHAEVMAELLKAHQEAAG